MRCVVRRFSRLKTVTPKRFESNTVDSDYRRRFDNRDEEPNPGRPPGSSIARHFGSGCHGCKCVRIMNWTVKSLKADLCVCVCVCVRHVYYAYSFD